MNIRKLFLIGLGVLGLGSSLGASHSDAALIRQCRLHDESRLNDETCACESALKKNTIVALEEFLRQYPLGTQPSACGALAFNALQNFTSNNPPGFVNREIGRGYGG